MRLTATTLLLLVSCSQSTLVISAECPKEILCKNWLMFLLLIEAGLFNHSGYKSNYINFLNKNLWLFLVQKKFHMVTENVFSG